MLGASRLYPVIQIHINLDVLRTQHYKLPRDKGQTGTITSSFFPDERKKGILVNLYFLVHGPSALHKGVLCSITDKYPGGGTLEPRGLSHINLSSHDF